jgi:hypothetical protein
MIEGRISQSSKRRSQTRATSLVYSFPEDRTALSTPQPVAGQETDLAIARRVVRSRNAREALFGSGLFIDPAWEVMLDLFIAGESGQKVSISSVCIAARVPATTALRWLKKLERRNLVVRILDEHDRRRCFLVLTEDARAKVACHLRDLNAALLNPLM